MLSNYHFQCSDNKREYCIGNFFCFCPYNRCNEVWLAVSYDSKALYIHTNRRRKKRSGPNIKPEYRLELVSVNSAELASVVAKESGEVLQNAEVEIVVVDKDKKAHSKTVTDAWVKFGMKVWLGPTGHNIHKDL